jgi:hypothetical protein
MEPNEPTLQEEVLHDKVVARSEVIIGALIVLVLILAGVIWYMAKHRAIQAIPDDTSTNNPLINGTTAQTPGKLDEHAQYYDITASYPTGAGASAVEAMKQFELSAIADFKQQGKFSNLSATDIKMMGYDQGRKESLDITYQMKSGANTISYVFTTVTDTFGAHPNTDFKTFTFDKKTGGMLSLSDLFAPGANYLASLSTIARKMLPATIAAREGIKASAVDTTMLNAGTSAKAENFKDWYVDGTNLVIVFPPYAVAAYAAGAQTLTIPFSQLTSLKANTKVNDFGVIQ